jgi:hypothetical protein
MDFFFYTLVYLQAETLMVSHSSPMCSWMHRIDTTAETRMPDVP